MWGRVCVFKGGQVGGFHTSGFRSGHSNWSNRFPGLWSGPRTKNFCVNFHFNCTSTLKSGPWRRSEPGKSGKPEQEMDNSCAEECLAKSLKVSLEISNKPPRGQDNGAPMMTIIGTMMGMMRMMMTKRKSTLGAGKVAAKPPTQSLAFIAICENLLAEKVKGAATIFDYEMSGQSRSRAGETIHESIMININQQIVSESRVLTSDAEDSRWLFRKGPPVDRIGH